MIALAENKLMTVLDVANFLQISPRTVYDNARRLGGFYPHNIKVLRFRPEAIYGYLERQGTQGMVLCLSEKQGELCRQGIQHAPGSADRQRLPFEKVKNEN